MPTSFIDRFEQSLKARNSVLCVGLDPALAEQRDKNVIPQQYTKESEDDSEIRLDFCLDILEQVSDFCSAAKPNEQYLRGFTSRQHQKLTKTMREHGLVSIYDCKLGDIRDTVESAIFYFHKWGYDGITFSPLPGNIEEVVKIAHKCDPQIGVIVLTLMSNPEAEMIMRIAKYHGRPIYEKLARDVKKYDADGCVVGATGHVTGDDVKLVRTIIGKNKILLIPGVGAQKGNPEKVIKNGGDNILINVGRDIIYSRSPRKKAEEYYRRFNKLRKE